jgi:hypothetical protein
MKAFFGLLETNYMAFSDSSYIPEATALELRRLLTQALTTASGSEAGSRIDYIQRNFSALDKFVASYRKTVKPSSAAFRDQHRVVAVDDATAIPHKTESAAGEYRFDGEQSHLRLKQPHAPGRAYTLEAWICPDALEIRPVIYGESFNTYEPYYVFGSNMVDPTYNRIGLAIVGKTIMFNDQRFGKVKSKPLDLVPGKWAHLMAVVDADNNEMAIYLDGEIIGLETVLDNYDKTPYIQIVGAGGDNQSSQVLTGCRGFFKGRIKGAAIYDAAITP